MTDLRELYQEVILDHYKKPRNFRAIEGGRKAEGFNPLCGDRVTVYVDMDGEKVREVAFKGRGCAISTASASLMTERIKGMDEREIDALFAAFRGLVTGEDDGATDGLEMGKLAALAGVRQFPIRVKCVTLAWHTLRAALKSEKETVSTE